MNKELKMKDITSHSQKETEEEKKTPRVLEFDACGIKFRVHRHIYHPGTWLLTCGEFGIEHEDLDTDDMKEAIHNAKVYMIRYIEGMRSQIDSTRKVILESEDCL